VQNVTLFIVYLLLFIDYSAVWSCLWVLFVIM